MRAFHGSPCYPDPSSIHKAGKNRLCSLSHIFLFSISEQLGMLRDSFSTYECRHFLWKEILMHKLMKHNPVSSPHRVRMREWGHRTPWTKPTRFTARPVILIILAQPKSLYENLLCWVIPYKNPPLFTDHGRNLRRPICCAHSQLLSHLLIIYPLLIAHQFVQLILILLWTSEDVLWANLWMFCTCINERICQPPELNEYKSVISAKISLQMCFS